jgi:hypothetical protein
MALHYNTDIRWYVGTFSVAGYAKSATFNAECAALDSTAIATSGWVEVIPGLKSGSFALDLMSEFTDGGLDETLQALLGVTDTPQSFSIGSTVGSPGYTFKSLPTQYQPVGGQVGEIARASLSGAGTGTLARGRALAIDTTATTSGTGTAVQAGAVVAGKAVYAGLHVTAVSGTTPSLAVTVQSDTVGFPSATGRISFAAANATTNRSQFLSAAGPITDDYWRVSYTISGTTPSFTFSVILGIG